MSSPLWPADGPIRSVLIVGGGAAGWMTAAALARALQSRCEVRLLEPAPAAGDTAVLFGADSTLPALRAFHGLLGLDEDTLLAGTGGAFKLGAELAGWSESSYIHPLGEFGATIDGVAFHDLWARLQAPGSDALEDYCLAAIAGRLDRFVRPGPDPRSVASTMSYGLHLDVDRYARALRRRAEGDGVVRVEGALAGVERGPHGLIEAVRLDGGERLVADLFVDCSGPAAVLGASPDWQDWSAWLPADRLAWTWRLQETAPAPLTRIEAEPAGYRITIPLQGRTAIAFVYASRFASDEAAAAALGAPDPQLVGFTPGRRAKPWNGNCVSIGLAAAALEPLGAVALQVVQSGVSKLLGLLPDRGFAGGEAEEYNRLMGEELDRIRDFLIAHYKLNGRLGDPLWDHARAMDVPEMLAWKMRLFESRGRVVLYDGETFLESSWIALFLGQGLTPRRHHPRADAVPSRELRERLGRMKALVRQAAESMPRHGEYIARYCAAEPAP